MRILVTAGGTKEYIDGVRYIGNSSSGQTGATLVDYLAVNGHEVTWLGAKTAIRPANAKHFLSFETFDELANAMQLTLAENNYDVVFQAAAVSDFKVSSILLAGQEFTSGRAVKLPSADDVQLILTKQPKLVAQIKNWSTNPEIKVVAFKLTNSKDKQSRQTAINKLLQQQVIDWVAHNDLNEITDQQHAFDLYAKHSSVIHCQDINRLADAVVEAYQEHL